LSSSDNYYINNQNKKIKLDKRIVYDKQSKFIGGILRSIDKYNDGRPHEAYSEFSKTMSERMASFRTILNTGVYEKNKSFYRIRKNSENYLIERKKMFHIPFEERRRVTTQRFSINGYPCLYLGTSIYVCWEELSRPKLNEFQISRLINNESIKFLDLSKPLMKGKNEVTKDMYRYFVLWPLIASCSLKVNSYDLPFKPEYIVPQLLLQWIREEKTFHAIRYYSTHIISKNKSIDGEIYNLVFPVEGIQESGYCPVLSKMFKITDPISHELFEILKGSSIVVDIDGIRKSVINNKIKDFKSINEFKSDYGDSVFGWLEDHLDSQETYEINPISKTIVLKSKVKP
jgi:hypothetical protein